MLVDRGPILLNLERCTSLMGILLTNLNSQHVSIEGAISQDTVRLIQESPQATIADSFPSAKNKSSEME